MKRALILIAVSCGNPSRDAGPAPAKDAAVAVAIDATGFSPIGPAATVDRTADGIPILDVAPSAADRTGDVTWLRSSSQVLQWTKNEASDGARIYFAMNNEGDDLLVRDGVMREHVLRTLGAIGPGCGAAVNGDLLLSAPVKHGHAVWRISPDGTLFEILLPQTIGGAGECRAWLAADGTYRLALFGIVDYDGKTFVEDRDFFSGRTVTGGVGRPLYCFSNCNATEAQRTAAATKQISDALGCGDADWVAWDDRVAGSCEGRVVRYREGGAPEVLDPAPASKMLSGHRTLAFTDRGDLVIGLDYGYARYVVWPDGSATATAPRTLGQGEVLANASPTLLVRGIGGAVPDAQVYAVVLGKDVGYGANGGTIGYASIDRSAKAHEAQVDRVAAAIARKAPLHVAGEAVFDMCGSYARSPIGWEDMEMSDFDPPTYPVINPKAVTRPPQCLGFQRVSALPGDPDLLLAYDDAGVLWGAWLPVPLPLPQGGHFGEPAPPTPKQDPKPGTGWSKLGDGVTKLAGTDDVVDPGANVEFAPGTWQYGGAMEITLSDATLLVTPNGTVTLPAGVTPMAVGQGELHAWGAIGGKLVDCAPDCRVLDPGVAANLVGVVPRTRTEVIVGYDDGRVGVYTIPATGGVTTPRHALADAIDALLAKRPR